MTTRTLQFPLQTRQADVVPTSLNSENRTVDLVWSTGAAVKRYDFWSDQVFMEELDMGGADLSRLNVGASLLNNHNSDDLANVIGVVERAWIDKKNQGVATVRFSGRDDVEPIWQDVKAGIIRHVSMGYSVEKAEMIHATPKGSGMDVLRVLEFTPQELSLVTVPADPGAQVRANPKMFPVTLLDEVSKMTDETKEVSGASPPDDPTVIRREFERAKVLGGREAIRAERQRVSGLDDLFSLNLVPRDEFFTGLRARAIDDGWEVEATRKYIMEVLSDQAEPVFDHTSIVADGDMGMRHAPPSTSPAPPAHPVRVQQEVTAGGGWKRHGMGRTEIVRDALETTVQSIEHALLVRCGIITDRKDIDEARARGMANLTYVEMGRRLFEASGQQQRIAGLDKNGIAKAMMARAAGPMTSSDFTGILANVATKIAKKGYQEAPTTWQEWCNTGFLPDFKAATIPGLGAFSDLDQIPDSGGPYLFGTFGDNYETATLKVHGKKFGIAWTALVNDDLNFFTRIGASMGAAAARKVNALAYAVLTANQTMTEDGTALFIAGHSNFVDTGSGAAPSIATLNAGEAAMMLQTSPKQSTDSSTVYLNLQPGHLLVPVSLGSTARTLISSQYDPAGTTASVSRRDAPNIWRDRLKVTVDAELGGASATGWYLAAPQGSAVIDTVTVFFLEGSGAEPYVEQREGWDSDGVEYKVRLPVVARALDYRGLYKNVGA